MQRLFSLIYRNRNFLIFLLLELLAIYFTIQSHSFHKSKFVNSANYVTGGVYSKVNNIKEFFLLKDENQRLSEENSYLRNLLEQQRIIESSNDSIELGVLDGGVKYYYIPAKITNNDYNKSNNYLTIESSSKEIEGDMGVINSKGIIGITKNVNGQYATVLSILNINSRINVKMLNSNYFGTLSWDGVDYQKVQLSDIPIQARIKIGDTVVTGGMSTIFPINIPVGTIKDFNVNNNNYDVINIDLFNDMSALSHVMVIKNFDRKAIESLEEVTKNE